MRHTGIASTILLASTALPLHASPLSDLWVCTSLEDLHRIIYAWFESEELAEDLLATYALEIDEHGVPRCFDPDIVMSEYRPEPVSIQLPDSNQFIDFSEATFVHHGEEYSGYIAVFDPSS